MYPAGLLPIARRRGPGRRKARKTFRENDIKKQEKKHEKNGVKNNKKTETKCMAKRGGKQTEKNFFPYRLPEMHFKT
ncbi:MAG: hypothetical protein BHW56_01310 [Acetobacter sp. 46_36]|nr:MAG: hypothetical protein BHW56_01310 [Acetobacter sp. 46_36]